MASYTWEFNALERTFNITDVSIAPPGDVEFLAGDAETSVGPTAGHVIFIKGRIGCTVEEDTGNNTLWIDVTGAGFDWTTVTGTTQALAVHNGYINTNVALTTYTLPATAAVGDTIILEGYGSGLFKVAQNAGQTIINGIVSTTAGVTGYIQTVQQYSTVVLRCIVANTTWKAYCDQGGMNVE